MRDAYRFSNYAKISVAYTLPSINKSYEVLSMRSGENGPSISLDTSLALVTEMYDVRSLLAVDYGSFGLKVNASNIFDGIVGRGVFSGRQFGA